MSARVADEPIRVLIWRTPRILGDIVGNALKAQPRFEIVLDRGSSPLAEAIRSSRADVVLTHGDAGSLADFAEPLHANPRTRIVALDTDGRTARLHLLRPVCVPLGEVSLESLTRTLREVADPRRAEGGVA